MKPKRLALWAVVVVVAVSLYFMLKPAELPVDMATAERGPLRVTIDEEGRTRSRDSYVVSAPFAGRVRRIELEPGDSVRADETVVASFEPLAPVPLDVRTSAEAEARVGAARATLRRVRADSQRSQAELDFARAELRRTGQLAQQKIVSSEALEAAELNARRAEKALEAAEQAVSEARHQLDLAQASLLRVWGNPGADAKLIRIRAPADGVVLRRFRESESVVPAGDPLVEIGDARELEIVADLLSSDAVKVEPGMRVEIVRWGGPKPLTGRVRLVEPSGFTKISALGVEEQRVNVIIDLEPGEPTARGLGDGFRVEIQIVLWHEDDLIKLPVSSLFRRGDAWHTFVVEAGVAVLRQLELGRRNGVEAEVLSGISQGETVIVHASDAIFDGARVIARER